MIRSTISRYFFFLPFLIDSGKGSSLSQFSVSIFEKWHQWRAFLKNYRTFQPWTSLFIPRLLNHESGVKNSKPMAGVALQSRERNCKLRIIQKSFYQNIPSFVITQGFAIHTLKFYKLWFEKNSTPDFSTQNFNLGLFEPQEVDEFLVGKWKVELFGLKIPGWIFGLKCPGLKFPATFLKSHWMVIFAWWFPKGFELAGFGIVNHAFNFRILCKKLIFLQNVFSSFRNWHKTFISHLFFIDLKPYCIWFWVNKCLCNRYRFWIC